jgi:hypothetical protein
MQHKTSLLYSVQVATSQRPVAKGGSLQSQKRSKRCHPSIPSLASLPIIPVPQLAPLQPTDIPSPFYDWRPGFGKSSFCARPILIFAVRGSWVTEIGALTTIQVRMPNWQRQVERGQKEPKSCLKEIFDLFAPFRFLLVQLAANQSLELLGTRN